MDDESLTVRYAEHAPVQRLVDLITYTAEGISLEFDRWDDPYISGPGLYVVVIAGTSIAEFADPMGTNRWPTGQCAIVTQDIDSFFETAEKVAKENDGAVIITVDGTVCKQMARLKDLSASEINALEIEGGFEYADWMGARHMSALDTSV